MTFALNTECSGRICAFPAPPEGFLPREAPNTKLAEYGLLERPDETTEPEAFAFWLEMFGSPLEIVQPSLPASATPTSAPAPVLASLRTRYRFRKRGRYHSESSANWSGAYVTPLPRPNRMVHVVGAWTVPAVSPPDIPPETTDPTNQEYRSSSWIGIGGDRRYNSMPQIGTSEVLKITNGQLSTSYAAWWQWWQSDEPSSHEQQPIPTPGGFDVAPGDTILASARVVAPSPGEVHFIIMNRRTRKLVPFLIRAPADIMPLGSSAEWIHERPSEPGTGYRYPLPKFTAITFRSCLAWSASDFGAPPRLQKLENNARLLRMHETFPSPHRSGIVSVPCRKSATTLEITYQEARPHDRLS